jgi:crotonobetainyl-CoA:carnitine CoA-transferase CaiB-like acyl-CoA transferase
MHGTRVIDASTVYTGPLACQLLGDFGADVMKIECGCRMSQVIGHEDS